ncbi:Hypothetical protein HVPorG_03891 (plasmid) [Roseomonas mucosa]|uniref:hypothetical protein n=1 Tax=Roseomonas mucosa TaxID=207340 RepID=UPI00220C3501|nr:hypothetical protein [Roseomonas mucosa]QDJ12260.1 Hypothetical protein HVPorG_03891 [Roseomonas mucosa]
MSLDQLYPTIRGDLRIVLTTAVDGTGFALSRTDCGEPVLVAVVPDGAGYGAGEAEGHARLLARAPTMLRLLDDALAIFAEEFEAPEDEEHPISGADMVERFAAWRERAKAALLAPIVPIRS